MRLAVRVDGRPDAEVVEFPERQPGARAMVGYGADRSGAYVLKVLKVADLRAALGGCIREPRYLSPLRRLPIADSPFAPSRTLRRRIAAFHDICRPWLRGLDRPRCRALLARTVPEIDPARHDELLDEAFAERPVLHLTPEMSRVVEVDFPDLGPAGVPALCQRAVTGEPYRMPLGGRRGDRDVAFLLLLATARRLSQVHALGLDLSCRPDRRTRSLVFPKVLADGRDLAYVDFFGWATPLGNVAERAGYRLGYGERGPGRRLLRTLAGRLAPA